jgi:catalase-peroxidase
MTVLVGGMRALETNVGGSTHCVLTDRPQVLSNDFFVNLLSPGTKWKASEGEGNVYEISDAAAGELKWTATPVDLVFGPNSQFRAPGRGLRERGRPGEVVNDFVAPWVKVMELDRFDLC